MSYTAESGTDYIDENYDINNIDRDLFVTLSKVFVKIELFCERVNSWMSSVPNYQKNKIKCYN